MQHNDNGPAPGSAAVPPRRDNALAARLAEHAEAMLAPWVGDPPLTHERVKHLAQGIAGGAMATVHYTLSGWVLAPHEDGSGNFALYHQWDGARSFLRVDCTSLDDLVTAACAHMCPAEPDSKPE